MGKPMAWIFTIARNLAMTKFRTEKKYANVEIDLEKEPAFSFVTDAEDRIVLQMAFNKLSQQEREIIFLHAVSGYSHREIAENLEIPLSTALSKYHRGLKKLKILLAQKEEVL
jgi:RNA polymerase sigma-70 factor (ECF subfamily)